MLEFIQASETFSVWLDFALLGIYFALNGVI